jgi:hypothetical protein
MIGIAWIAKLALGGLLKIGVSERIAGKVTGSKLFGPIALVVVGFVGWQVLGLVAGINDRRVGYQAAKTAIKQCVAEHEIAASRQREYSLKLAVERATTTLAARESEKTALEARIAGLELEQQGARDASKSPDRMCVEPDDSWVQRGPVRRR